MIVTTMAGLKDLKGAEIGSSRWIRVEQDRIQRFADATDDQQWIHTDPARAAQGPFGTTIAHGYLTLSLIIPMWTEMLEVTDAKTKVNYGLNKVRFPAPVPVGSHICMTATLGLIRNLTAARRQSSMGEREPQRRSREGKQQTGDHQLRLGRS